MAVKHSIILAILWNSQATILVRTPTVEMEFDYVGTAIDTDVGDEPKEKNIRNISALYAILS